MTAAIDPKRNDCTRSEEHTSELQSLRHLVCRLLLEKKKHATLFQAPMESPPYDMGLMVNSPPPFRSTKSAASTQTASRSLPVSFFFNFFFFKSPPPPQFPPSPPTPLSSY